MAAKKVFKRKMVSVVDFPSTTRSNTAKLKTLLLSISAESQFTQDAPEEAKAVITAFLKEWA